MAITSMTNLQIYLIKYLQQLFLEAKYFSSAFQKYFMASSNSDLNIKLCHLFTAFLSLFRNGSEHVSWLAALEGWLMFCVSSSQCPPLQCKLQTGICSNLMCHSDCPTGNLKLGPQSNKSPLLKRWKTYKILLHSLQRKGHKIMVGCLAKETV